MSGQIPSSVSTRNGVEEDKAIVNFILLSANKTDFRRSAPLILPDINTCANLLMNSAGAIPLIIFYT